MLSLAHSAKSSTFVISCGPRVFAETLIGKDRFELSLEMSILKPVLLRSAVASSGRSRVTVPSKADCFALSLGGDDG